MILVASLKYIPTLPLDNKYPKPYLLVKSTHRDTHKDPPLQATKYQIPYIYIYQDTALYLRTTSGIRISVFIAWLFRVVV